MSLLLLLRILSQRHLQTHSFVDRLFSRMSKTKFHNIANKKTPCVHMKDFLSTKDISLQGHSHSHLLKHKGLFFTVLYFFYFLLDNRCQFYYCKEFCFSTLICVILCYSHTLFISPFVHSLIFLTWLAGKQLDFAHSMSSIK